MEINFRSLIEYMFNFLYLKYKNYFYFKKKRKIYKNIKSSYNFSFGNEFLSSYKKYWSGFESKPDQHYYQIYSFLSNQDSAQFVPENFYYLFIEPRLNNHLMLLSFSDKNSYNMSYEENLFPKIILRNIDGVFYNDKYERINYDFNKFIPIEKRFTKIVVKPSLDTGGGRNIDIFKWEQSQYINKENHILSSSYLKKYFNINYLIQEYIYQHDYFNSLNPTSVNTVRIMTYKSVVNDKIVILQSVLRIGKKDSIVDNLAAGGIALGVNNEGFLTDFAVDKFGNKYYTSNNIKFADIGPIPKFEEMKSIAKSLARKNIYSRLIGWDFALDNQNEIKVIELNNTNIEINFTQMTNGPLFREYTNEVKTFCIQQRMKLRLHIFR